MTMWGGSGSIFILIIFLLKGILVLSAGVSILFSFLGLIFAILGTFHRMKASLFGPIFLVSMWLSYKLFFDDYGVSTLLVTLMSFGMVSLAVATFILFFDPFNGKENNTNEGDG
jgi:hypothetical protein